MQRITQTRVRNMKRKPNTTSRNKNAGYRQPRPRALYRADALHHEAHPPSSFIRAYHAGGSCLICLHTGGSAAHSARLWLALTVPPISRPIGNAARSSTSVRFTADLTPIRSLFIPSCRTPEATAMFWHFRACAAFGVDAWPVRYLTRH